MRKLRGEERARLIAALIDAFPSPGDFEMLLQLKLDRSLVVVAPIGATYEYTVFRVIDRSEAEGWTADLVLAASAARPDSEGLAAVAASLWIALEPDTELERMISPRNGVYDVEEWLSQLWRNGCHVCRLEIGTRTAIFGGTGFLVGPDLVLTNFHVVEPLFLSGDPVAASSVRFDLRAGPDGQTVPRGRSCSLAEEWLPAWSPHDQAHEQSLGSAAGETNLDYALLRLAEPVGEEGVGLDGEATARRGWVGLRVNARVPAVDDQVLILQHPGGDNLKLAVDRVVALEGERPIVRYLTNTDEGSSGSPCFSFGWELMALHQGGSAGGASNQGVAARAIAEHIVARLGASALRDPEDAP